MDKAMAQAKRAYSEAAKQAREEKILLAAENLLMEREFYSINMEQVAQAAGLAKGTVYLYFKTKEELFITVFERQSMLWLEELETVLKELPEDSSPEMLVDCLVESVAEKALFTRLVALSSTIFEYNISFERAREHKLWVFASLDKLGALIDSKFRLPIRGADLLFKNFVLVAGLEGFTHPSAITREVFETESRLHKADFAEELRTMLLLLTKR